LKSCMVAPAAYKAWRTKMELGIRKDETIKVDALYSGHWETITSDWILHTPFTVRVYVNDTLFGEKMIDEIGVVTTSTIGLGEELMIGSGSQYLTVTKLGALGTGYTLPIWQSVVWFNNQYFYLNSEAVQKAIRSPYPYGGAVEIGIMNVGTYEDSFAWYWYGGVHESFGSLLPYDRYWKDDGGPVPGVSDPVGFYELIPASEIGGWVDVSDMWAWGLSPVRPVLYPTEKSSLPTDKRGWYSLMEFLDKVTMAQRPLMPSWEPNPNNVVFVTTDAQNGYLRVYLPWNSFSNLIDICISSELANTIVWEPQVANIKIVDCPSDIGEIGERKTVSLTLRQTSAVASDGYVKLVPITQGLYWSFQPPTFGTGRMNPDDSKTFTFDVVNLGQPTDTTFKFRAEVYNSLGQMTDSREVIGTLLARGQQGSVLVVQTIDKKTKIDVSGIHVIVNYDTISKEGWTSGGAVSFDFGGGTPTVTISTVETTIYKSATITKALSLGQNEVTIELIRQGETEPQDWLWLILVIVIAVTIAAVAITVAKRRR